MKTINDIIFEILNTSNLINKVKNIKNTNPNKYNKIYTRTLDSSRKYTMLQHTRNLPKDDKGNIDPSSLPRNDKIRKNLQSVLHNISPQNINR